MPCGQTVGQSALLRSLTYVLYKIYSIHCKDTIPKIRNKFSQTRNCTASVPISTCMCLWPIYIFPWSVRLFCLRKICAPILGIYKSLTDTWMWKLEIRPRNSFSGNTKNRFSLQCTHAQPHLFLLCYVSTVRVRFSTFAWHLLAFVMDLRNDFSRITFEINTDPDPDPDPALHKAKKSWKNRRNFLTSGQNSKFLKASLQK